MCSSAKMTVAFILIVGCGGDDNNAPADAPGSSQVNGCTAASAMDLTASTATRTISFSGTSYTPKCAKIKAGQNVTFSGAFSTHPLRAGTVVGTTRTPQTGSPITDQDTGTEATFSFPSAGTFPFYCNFHYQSGMFGTLYVDP